MALVRANEANKRLMDGLFRLEWLPLIAQKIFSWQSNKTFFSSQLH
jgi:hypothetical protein